MRNTKKVAEQTGLSTQKILLDSRQGLLVADECSTPLSKQYTDEELAKWCLRLCVERAQALQLSRETVINALTSLWKVPNDEE